MSHGERIRNVNRLSQSRARTVWKERVSTLTEGHARFWANGKIVGHFACVWMCVRVRIRVAWGRMWDWLSLLSIMNG